MTWWRARKEWDPRSRADALRETYSELDRPATWAIQAWPLVRRQASLLSQHWDSKKGHGPRFVPEGSYWLEVLRDVVGVPSWALADSLDLLYLIHDLERHDGKGRDICFHVDPLAVVDFECRDCEKRWTCDDCGATFVLHDPCEEYPLDLVRSEAGARREVRAIRTISFGGV